MNETSFPISNMKSHFRIFMPWNYELEEKWLQDMAKSGWMLEDYCFIRYKFSLSKPGDYVYRIDFRSNRKNELTEYLHLFRSAGWEHIVSCANWQYFRIPEDRFTTDIYSDPTSKIDKFKRMVGFSCLLLFPNLLLLFMTAPDLLPIANSARYILTFIRILLHGIATGLPLFWVINLNKKITELKMEL